jgi:RNA polymerase sigma-70 factor, ECF subfamily
LAPIKLKGSPDLIAQQVLERAQIGGGRLHSLEQPAGPLAFNPTLHDSAPSVLADPEVLTLVVRHLRKFAGPHPEFDDLVQKALLEAHRSLPNFRGESQLSTFLYAICYRVWTHHLRWHSRFLRRFQVTEPTQLPETKDAHDPAELALHRERYRALYGALEKLPPKMRAVVVLHDLDELEIEEISLIVQTNAHTVRSRLRYGREKLRSLLERSPPFRGPV